MVVYSPWGLKELDTTEVTGHAHTQYSIVSMYHIFFEMAHFSALGCRGEQLQSLHSWGLCVV